MKKGWQWGGFCIGIVVMLWHAGYGVMVFFFAPPELPVIYKGHLAGVVVSLPAIAHAKQRFVVQTKWGKVRLAWYGPYHRVIPGERWHWQVKVTSAYRPIRIHAFRYDRWLRANGLVATGYIINGPYNQLIDHGFWRDPLDNLRYDLQKQLYHYNYWHSQVGILIALALGDRGGLTAYDWQILQRTGTSHLVAISGLHIGLVAGLAYWIFRVAAIVFLPWLRRFPAQYFAWGGAWLVALLYSALAGFSVSTERTLIMLSVLGWVRLTRRSIRPFTAWCVALFVVLLWQPTSISLAGAWLSFSAVAVLIYGLSSRVSQRPIWQRCWWPQWVVFLGLLPVSLFWFQRIAWVSVCANIIAIPVVSLLVVPFDLLGMLSVFLNHSLSQGLFFIANQVMQGVWWYLSWLANHAWWGVKGIAVTMQQGLFLLCGSMLLLAPRSFPGRWIGMVLLFSLLYTQ